MPTDSLLDKEALKHFEGGIHRLLSFSPKKALYEGCCPLDALCPKHFHLHQQRCGAMKDCEVCKWNLGKN